MLRYRFSLQKLLEAREREEDEKKQDFAKAQRIFAREEERLGKYLLFWEECRREVLQRRDRKIDVAREAQWRSYFEYLAAEISRQRETVKHCSRKVEEARIALIKASKERKAIEKLKENEKIEYMRQVNILEQKELDEVGRDLYLRTRRREATGSEK